MNIYYYYYLTYLYFYFILGKQFAMLEMKIVLSHVLRKFKIFSLDHKEDVTLTFEIILKSAKPLRMQFIPR